MRHEKIINRVYDPRRLRTAWHQVKKNAGAAGIDQMSVNDFDERKDELLPLIHEKLRQDRYRFRPAKKETRFVMNLTWFRNQGLYFLHVKKQKTLELPFGC